MHRRDLLRLLAAAPMAAGFAWSDAEASEALDLVQAAQTAAAAGTPFTPKFFTAHEWQTVRVLVDLIIPKDERSGSATDAGVPEFMDFMMFDQPARQVPMRGGLAWLELECHRRFDKAFANCTVAEQTAVLDDIAWPFDSPRGRLAHGKPFDDLERAQLRPGIEFFNSFRDLTSAGFWTTRIGIDDLQYMGNRSVARWNGCPDEALKKLGVKYPDA